MKAKRLKSVLWIGGGVLVAGLLPWFLHWLLAGHLESGSAVPQGVTLDLRETEVWKQWLVVLVGFGIKPAYILIASFLIVRLWRQRASDLAALRWGLIAFWLGENACSANYLFLHGNSDAWEYLHNFGMAVCFSFVTYALLEGMDRRLIKYSSANDRCAALSLCRGCIKYDPEAACGLRRVFSVLIPATIVLVAMLLGAEINPTYYVTRILGSTVHYSQSLTDQLFEMRYCPILAILLLTVSWLVLLFKREEPVELAKVFFAAGIGPFGFGLLRLFLGTAYRQDLIQYVVWEEITELIFTAGAAYVLFLFRHSLLAKKPQPEPILTDPQLRSL